jgi:hypothetical protein
VIAVVSATVGALSGVAVSYVQLRNAKETLSRQERDAWRKTLVDATGALIDAWHELRWFLHARSTENSEAPVFDEGARKRVDPLGTRCAQKVSLIILLYGSESEAGEAAFELDSKIADLKELVNNASTPWNELTKRNIKSALLAASSAHENFLRKAHAPITPKQWHSA